MKKPGLYSEEGPDQKRTVNKYESSSNNNSNTQSWHSRVQVTSFGDQIRGADNKNSTPFNKTESSENEHSLLEYKRRNLYDLSLKYDAKLEFNKYVESLPKSESR